MICCCWGCGAVLLQRWECTPVCSAPGFPGAWPAASHPSTCCVADGLPGGRVGREREGDPHSGRAAASLSGGVGKSHHLQSDGKRLQSAWLGRGGCCHGEETDNRVRSCPPPASSPLPWCMGWDFPHPLSFATTGGRCVAPCLGAVHATWGACCTWQHPPACPAAS